MSTSPQKQIIWGLGIFVFIFFSANQIYNFGDVFFNKIKVFKTASVFENSIILEKKNVSLAFVGDIMLDRGVKSSVNKNFFGDYGELFSKVSDRLQKYDILVGNLEGPISNGGVDGGGVYSFRFEPKVAEVLKDVGFDILSIANNHIYNWGGVAFIDTLKSISEIKIDYIGGGFTGTEAYKEKIINLEGVTLAFLAFSEFKEGMVTKDSTFPGIAVISEEQIKEGVLKAKMRADLVITSFHFGEEYADLPNGYQRRISELAVDSGADLVIGHHSHVVGSLEKYNNSYIIYSLGNFIFDQYFSEKTMQGGLLEVEVDSKNKKIEKVNLKKVLLNKYYQIEDII